MQRLGAALLFIGLVCQWEPAIPHVPPGGFATVTVEGVRHGDRHVPPTLHLLFRCDQKHTAILVRLDGKYMTASGQPFHSLTTNPQDVPQWTCPESQPISVTVTGLGKGVHHLEILEGILGSSLPLVNEQEIWFAVGE